VNYQTKTTKRTFAFYTRNQICRYSDTLKSGAQHEFAWVQHERLAIGNLYQFSEVCEIFLHIKNGRSVVTKDAKEVRDFHVDAARLHAGFIEWLNNDATIVDLGSKVSV
jgi:hypothetical protein